MEDCSEGGETVQVTRKGARTEYVVGMGRRVGYLGGDQGKARGNPSLERVLIVVQGENRVVTAYPVE